MTVKALQEYTRFSKYAKYVPEQKRRETWKEQVDRVFDMHEHKYNGVLDDMREDFEFAKDMVMKKRVLGSQRALQFGGDPILKKNARLYNCTVSYVDRVRFFQECMYLLLCGCGAGFSVQTHHIAKLPKVACRTKGTKSYIIDDSIEGWADSIGVLMSSYFTSGQTEPDYCGYEVEFDYKNIRPAGAPISSGSKAPGPDGLRNAHNKIKELLDGCCDSGKLTSIVAYDTIMHISDAVLSGGVRRSATICIFSPDDDEMAKAKTGNWFIDNPQRGRSNNSAILVRSETTKETFGKLMKSVREFGEPGFVWAESTEALYNPCVEIGMYAYDEDGNSGWEFCNLCEMNLKKVKSKEEFLETCKAAAILGTLQAGYTTFAYLGETSQKIVEREALLGVSMTGMMDSPDIAFDPEIQKEGARLIKKVNERIAKVIGINPAARTTCVKPAGTTSCILGTASGIHPHHSKRYFRRVQANKLESPLKFFEAWNPKAVEESVWSNNGTDVVITFLCEVPSGARTKVDVDAIELLDKVRLTQMNWVEAGIRKGASSQPWLKHNVSNTITVKDDEWGDVEDYIYKNRKWFAGISLLPFSGDKDYPQAPFCKIMSLNEITKIYGECCLFASGLIEHALNVFDNNLWAACDSANGIGVDLTIKEGMKNKEVKVVVAKKEWVDRVRQFAERYLDGDVRKTSYLLKDTYNLKMWNDLKREYKEPDWSLCSEESDDVDYGQILACHGGSCDLV